MTDETWASAALAPNGLLGLDAVRVGVGLATSLPVVAWSLTTVLGILLFSVLIRSNREGDTVGAPGLAASAFYASADAPPTFPSSPAQRRATRSTGAPQVSSVQVKPAEANLPRWLRPSLREERRSR